MYSLGIYESSFFKLAQFCRCAQEEGENGELDYGGLTEGEFVHGNMIMGLLGYDLEDMSFDEKVQEIAENPDYLKLVPRLEVSGQWVHTIRETEVDDLEFIAESISSESNEMCFTDANDKEFWNFSEYRRFGLVFEGTCRVLWNADMYSSLDEDGYLRAVDDEKTFIDEMTEGWGTPSSMSLTGLRVREDEYLMEEMDQIIEIVNNLGIRWDQGEQIRKQLVGVDVVSMEEAQEYYDKPYDSIDDMVRSDNPEVLYEEVGPGKMYQEQINEILIQGAYKQDLGAVQYALQGGADTEALGEALQASASSGSYNIVKFLLDSGADVNYRNGGPVNLAMSNSDLDMVNLLLNYGADVNQESLNYWLRAKARMDEFDFVETLLNAGADVNDRNGFIFEMGLSPQMTAFLKKHQAAGQKAAYRRG